MKLMILGDVHGNTNWVIRVINDSKHIDYSKIVQVGDFGLWDHLHNGVKYLDDVNTTLSHFGRTMYAIGGNHENWDHWNWYVENLPKDNDGFAILRRHIRLAPRVHRWIWLEKDRTGDKSFVKMQAVAGAHSIDKGLRLQNEAAGSPKQWWPQEQITDEEIDAMPSGPVDYLFTHDCSNRSPHKYALVPDFDSQIHRQRIDRAIKKAKPKMHFHGHMHARYDWQNYIGDDQWVQTYGLDCDGMLNSWGILDTDTDTFTFNR